MGVPPTKLGDMGDPPTKVDGLGDMVGSPGNLDRLGGTKPPDLGESPTKMGVREGLPA